MNTQHSSYVYDQNGNLVRTEMPNGTMETRQYDVLNRLVYLENSGPNGVINSFRYTLDATGNRTGVVEQDGRRVEYSYDDLYRLTQETIFAPGATTASRTISYTYDVVGNRLVRNDSAEGVTTYTYDNNDRLLTEITNGVATQYSYDNNGNTTGKTTNGTTIAYNWNVENRLISADTNGDGTVDVVNQYNSDGIRVSQTVNGQETRFLIDEVQPYAQVVEEYTPGGIIKVSYAYGNDLISQNREGDTSFYHVDGLGSTRALTDEIGLISDIYIYDAFGDNIQVIGSSNNNYLFTGEQHDPFLNLGYLRDRYINLSAGRFSSRDTFSGFRQNPLSMHRYIYANLNPVNLGDPSGFAAISLSEQQATSSIQSILLRTLSVTQKVTESFQRAETILSIVNGISTAFNLSNSIFKIDSLTKRSLKKTIDLDIKEAAESFLANGNKIIKELLVISSVMRIRGLLSQPPTKAPYTLFGPSVPGLSNAVKIDLPRNIKIVNRPVQVVLGGYTGRIFGFGIGGDSGQLWRMDYHPWHYSNSKTEVRKGNEVAWRDGDFHYHVRIK
jgi:RHS repeat-associated protein